MNDKRLPDYREKQKILYIDKKPAKVLIDYGDQFFKRGQIADALEFYQRASYEQGLEKIKTLSEGQGDAMIFQQAMKALNRKISPEEWDRIGNSALDNRKFLFARHAFTISGNEAMRDKIQRLIADENMDSSHDKA